jgi:hypothetical protein
MVTSPLARNYTHDATLTVNFSAFDNISGVNEVSATLDGAPIENRQSLDLLNYGLGEHILIMEAIDNAGNSTRETISFNVVATVDSLISVTERLFSQGLIDNSGAKDSLEVKLKLAKEKIEKGKIDTAMNILNAFINEVHAQKGKHISSKAGVILIADAQYLMTCLSD